MFKRILIAVDGSGPARRAMRFGGKLALESDATVKLVHVVHPPEMVPDAITVEDHMLCKGEALLSQLRKHLPELSHIEDQVLEGRPADAIVKEAREWKADLVVVGDHNRNVFSRFFLGSNAEAVVRRAPCPVLVVRPKEEKPGKDVESAPETVHA